MCDGVRRIILRMIGDVGTFDADGIHCIGEGRHDRNSLCGASDTKSVMALVCILNPADFIIVGGQGASQFLCSFGFGTKAKDVIETLILFTTQSTLEVVHAREMAISPTVCSGLFTCSVTGGIAHVSFRREVYLRQCPSV